MEEMHGLRVTIHHKSRIMNNPSTDLRSKNKRQNIQVPLF